MESPAPLSARGQSNHRAGQVEAVGGVKVLTSRDSEGEAVHTGLIASALKMQR